MARFVACPLLCAILPALLSTLGALAPAHAAPVVDNDQGAWVDDYRDNLGVDLENTTNIVHDPFARLLTMEDPPSAPNDPATFITTPIRPASFSAWGAIDLAYSAVNPADVSVLVLGESGATYGPFVPGPGAATGFNGRIDLAALAPPIDPALEPSIRLQVTLTAATLDQMTIRPTIQSLRVTWTPLAVVRVTYEPQPSACAGDDLTFRVRVSASSVKARDVVVVVPMPAALVNPFGQDLALRFTGASRSGLYLPANASPLDLGHIQVDPNSVYWRLGDLKAGSSFILTFTANLPLGTLDQTLYSSHALARAANGPLVETDSATSSASSSAQPFAKLESAGTFQQFGQQRILAGRPLTFFLDVGNYGDTASARCGETYFEAVAWADLSEWVNPGGATRYQDPPGIYEVSPGGQWHGGPEPLCVSGTVVGQDCLGGVWVPPYSLYWELGHLGVQTRQRLSYSLLVEDVAPLGPLFNDQTIGHTAGIASAFEGNPRSASHSITIGVNHRPDGAYGIGEFGLFYWSITGGADDVPDKTLNYGDLNTYLYAIQNKGVSALINNWIVAKVPDDATFMSAWAPSGQGIITWYHQGGEELPPDSPPDFDDGNGAPDAGQWSQTLPTDPSTVQWVAWYVPRVTSAIFPESGFYSLLVTSMSVKVDEPEDQCPSMTLVAPANFYRYGYDPLGDELPVPENLVFHDYESTEVVPVVPYLQVAVDATPKVLLGAGEAHFDVRILNRHPRGATVDTAYDLVSVITLPRASINGVEQPLPLVSIDAPGGTLDLSKLPDEVTVRWPALFPQLQRNVGIVVRAPRGMERGASFGVAARASGEDDVCGTSSAGAWGSASIQVDPRFDELDKRANLSIVDGETIIT